MEGFVPRNHTKSGMKTGLKSTLKTLLKSTLNPTDAESSMASFWQLKEKDSIMRKYVFVVFVMVLFGMVLGCDNEATSKTSTNASDGSSSTESVGEKQ